MRQIVLDTETTGLEPEQGHRIIEIGCVELVGRRRSGRQYHQYLQPDREVDSGAVEVHGITNDFLADKPRFSDVAKEFLEFIQGAELVIHNAPFDVGFLNNELRLLGPTFGALNDYCSVLDTLALARQLHVGQRNSLDALCKRYSVDNSQRQWHGALLDAEILTDVYLAMTGGQVTLGLTTDDERAPRHSGDASAGRKRTGPRPALKVIVAQEAELAAHSKRLAAIDKESAGKCVWYRIAPQLKES
jgi:DNA polymerase-3 subunit epsilon